MTYDFPKKVVIPSKIPHWVSWVIQSNMSDGKDRFVHMGGMGVWAAGGVLIGLREL